MSNKTERKAKLNAWKAEQRQRAQQRFPLEDTSLSAFFSAIELAVENIGCQHDIRQAQRIIDAMALTDGEANALLDWCAEHGGFCDCEIAANAGQHWRENRASVGVDMPPLTDAE